MREAIKTGLGTGLAALLVSTAVALAVMLICGDLPSPEEMQEDPVALATSKTVLMAACAAQVAGVMTLGILLPLRRRRLRSLKGRAERRERRG